jgi:hypothetical protein
MKEKTMKYCLNPESKVSKLQKIGEVFISRPLKFSKLKELVGKKGVRKVFCSKSCLQRMPVKAKRFLQENGIEVLRQNLKGKPLSLSAEKILELSELRKDGLGFREIAEKLGTSKSTAHYLAKYAQRTKLKSKGRTVASV